MNTEAMPDLKKKVASKRIFQFLNKNPTETRAKTFFSKAKQPNTTALTTIFEDSTAIDMTDKITDSPILISENQGNSYRNSPFNSSFSEHNKTFTQIRGTSPTTSLLLRSGSLSPKSFMPGRRSEENNYKGIL